MPRDIHRIGGASVENLRLKPKEAAMAIPGISVLKANNPAEAAQQIRAAYPKAKGLDEAAKTIGSSSSELIHSTGFDLIAVPTKSLPNHWRIIHPDGAAGFSDANLDALAKVFMESTGH